MPWNKAAEDEPGPDAVAEPVEDFGALLDDVASHVKRFVVLSRDELHAITLWVAHTHAFEAADTTPYLNIGSAEKQSGKTRLLEVLEGLVARPWLTSSVTTAILPRKIEAEKPTLLLDESDAAFQGDKDYAHALRGILNSGYHVGGKRSVCVGSGKDIKYRDFKTFCPKAVAGIGRPLPDTVADRSIRIEMRRKIKDEHVERFRRREAVPQALALHEQLAAWADSETIRRLEEMRPEIPDSLGDRAQDVWEPLLAIADLAGGPWPDQARIAAEALSARKAKEDDSLGVRLLADISKIFEDRGIHRIASVDLAFRLSAIETSPWGVDRRGRRFDERQLAALLSPFDIRPRQVWLNAKNVRGYERSYFADAFARYVPSPTSDRTTARPLEPLSNEASSPNGQDTGDMSPLGKKHWRDGRSSGLADEIHRDVSEASSAWTLDTPAAAVRAEHDHLSAFHRIGGDIRERIKKISEQQRVRIIEIDPE